MAFKLLCCDGGGIRGLMTALLIRDLDQRFGVIDKADGFAGTSTGGLIALALAHGQSIDTIVDMYLKDGSTIFERNGWLADDRPRDRIRTSRKASRRSIPGRVLSRASTATTGWPGLRNSCWGRAPWARSTNTWPSTAPACGTALPGRARRCPMPSHNPYRDVKLRDAALATSAAPTYFPPYEIPGLGYFADGGTFANNPCMTALADARAGDRFSSLDDTVTLSLGTGVVPAGIRPQAISDPLDWGVTHWMWPWSFDGVPSMALLDLMMACTSQAATSAGTRVAGVPFLSRQRDPEPGHSPGCLATGRCAEKRRRTVHAEPRMGPGALLGTAALGLGPIRRPRSPRAGVSMRGSGTAGLFVWPKVTRVADPVRRCAGRLGSSGCIRRAIFIDKPLQMNLLGA